VFLRRGTTRSHVAGVFVVATNGANARAADYFEPRRFRNLSYSAFAAM